MELRLEISGIWGEATIFSWVFESGCGFFGRNRGLVGGVVAIRQDRQEKMRKNSQKFTEFDQKYAKIYKSVCFCALLYIFLRYFFQPQRPQRF